MASNGTSGTPPVKEIRVGGITAAIWERPAPPNGSAAGHFSVRVSKSYKDKKSNAFKTTEYYFPSDLPKLILAAEKAFEFISLKESTSAAANDV